MGVLIYQHTKTTAMSLGSTRFEPGTSGTSIFDACSGPPKWLTNVDNSEKINDCVCEWMCECFKDIK